jgi:hypothetical protein
MTDDLPPRAPVPGDTPTDSLPTAVDIARRAVRTGIRVSPSVAAELLEEYDRRAAEIEQRRAALCRALAIPDHTPWEAALESARAALAASRPPQEETSAEVFALREAAAQARWNVNHREGGTDNLDAYERHWRGTAVWLEKRAAAIEHGEQPDRGYRPVPADPDGEETR